MIWGNLAMLGFGGVMLSVPVLIHFLMKPQAIEVDFPALRFLKEKKLVSRSRSKLRHILLLLLRCLMIGLLVLALAGPAVASQEFGKWLTFGGIAFIGSLLGLVLLLSISSGTQNKLFNGILGTLFALALLLAGWYGLKLFDKDASGQLLGDSGEPVAALVVLDTSPTMQYELENETRLLKAKSVATWLVNQFPAGSQICVAAPDGDGAFFSVDQGAANRRIESLETSFNPQPIPETLARAFPLVEESPLTRKEVYVVSDLTRKGWSQSTDPAINRLIEQDDIPLFVVDVGVEEPVDFRLDALEISDRQITSNGLLKVKATANRLGAAADRNIQLTVEMPDKTRPVISNGQALFPDPEKSWVTTNLVNIFDNGTTTTEFQFQEALEPGVYHGKVEIVGGDPLGIDDEQYFTFEVSSPWQALIVRPRGTESNILESVLSVSGSFEATVVDQSELVNFRDFEKYSSVFLVDPGPIDEEMWNTLQRYVNGGGGLGVFLGHNAATREGLPDPSFQTDAASQILTGKLSNTFRCPDRIASPFVLSPQSYAHPVLSSFREYSTSVPWSKYPVFRFWGLERDDLEFPTLDVAVYNNFEPAIMERRMGSGRIIVMTTPISEPVNLRGRKSWNQRPLRIFEWFLVLRGISRYVVQADSDALDVRVGSIASLRNDLKKYPDAWNVFSPDPERPPGKIATVNNSVSYSNIDLPGHYRLKGVLDGPVLRGFSANIDPKTVDLTRVVPEELDKVLGAGRYQLAKEQDEITRQQGQARKGREFYPLLMMMMFAAIVIEYLVSNRFYKH